MSVKYIYICTSKCILGLFRGIILEKVEKKIWYIIKLFSKLFVTQKGKISDIKKKYSKRRKNSYPSYLLVQTCSRYCLKKPADMSNFSEAEVSVAVI